MTKVRFSLSTILSFFVSFSFWGIYLIVHLYFLHLFFHSYLYRPEHTPNTSVGLGIRKTLQQYTLTFKTPLMGSSVESSCWCMWLNGFKSRHFEANVLNINSYIYDKLFYLVALKGYYPQDLYLDCQAKTSCRMAHLRASEQILVFRIRATQWIKDLLLLTSLCSWVDTRLLTFFFQ